VSFEGWPAKTCDERCQSVGAKCSDTGGFPCGFNHVSYEIGYGSCGGVYGAWDSAQGSFGGVDYKQGVSCASLIPSSSYYEYVKCHCVK
jgi:hypothetical protein